MKQILVFFLLVAAACATPQCSWLCDDPVCEATCLPVCKKPTCQIQCEGGVDPLAVCSPLNCYSQCPPHSNETDFCPECAVKCNPVSCGSNTCSPLCEELECSWQCFKPFCLPPVCELQCERPACEYSASFVAKPLFVFVFALLLVTHTAIEWA